MTRIVAFHQDTNGSNGEYAAHAERLRAECKSVGQPASIVKRNYGTDYLSITRAKPLFILEQLDKWNEPLLYLDVDSTILKVWDKPTPERIGWVARQNGLPHGHLHHLPNNTETREFLHAWLDALNGWEGGDHSAMWLAIKHTGYKWESLSGTDAYVGIGISDNEATHRAQRHLRSIRWGRTLRAQLAG